VQERATGRLAKLDKFTGNGAFWSTIWARISAAKAASGWSGAYE
jgi:hypothetical protein